MGEMIVYGIKIAFAISIGLAFAIAINALIQGIVSIVFGNIIGEVLGIISMCLPFDARAVFSAIVGSMSAILAFMIAKKLWELSSDLFSLTA